MRRGMPTILAGALILAACGSSESDSTPAACRGPAGSYLRALDAAPSAVLLDDVTPISDCLPGNQTAGDQADVGQALVRSATVLNAEARRDPGGAETVQLGYLVGAVDAGAGDGTGIHADLLRRLEAATRFEAGSGRSAAFDLAYARGYAAGRAEG